MISTEISRMLVTMRTGKWLSVAVGMVVALLVLALLAVWMLVDPNLYKDRIAAAVKQSTGRELDLKGDIKLSVFPWVALELGPATLSSPPGFGAEPFVSFQHAKVRAKLLPLLQKKLEVARLEVDELDVRLQKNADGRGNWESPAAADEPEGQARVVTSPDEEPHVLPGLNDIRVTHARVSYQGVVVDALSIETGHITEGVIPIAVHFNVTRGIAAEHASVDAKLDVSGDSAARQYRIAALTMIGQVTLADNPRPLRWNLSLPALEVNLAAQTVSVPSIALTLAGAQLNGNVEATRIIDDLDLNGSLTLAPLVLGEFFPRLGVTPPKTQDARAFSELSGSTAFSYGTKVARLDSLRVSFDDTHLQGHLTVNTAEAPTLQFALSADRIDLDRYLPPDEPAAAPTAAPSATKPSPTAEKQRFKADGTVALGSLHLSRLDLTQLHFTLAANEDSLRIFPLEALVDGGRYSGDVTFDESGKVPSLAVDEHVSGVDMGRLLATKGKKVHLSGKGDFSVKAKGNGATVEALLRTLTGHVDARVINGAVEGVDLAYDLNQAESLIKQGAVAAVPDTGRTRFDVFKTTADISNGVARTSDLAIASPVLRISGQGSTDLVTKAIDFALVAEPILSSGAAIQVPVKVSGTTADPTVRPDIAALAKGQLGQKLKDVLHDKLKGLFGKP